MINDGDFVKKTQKIYKKLAKLTDLMQQAATKSGAILEKNLPFHGFYFPPDCQLRLWDMSASKSSHF